MSRGFDTDDIGLSLKILLVIVGLATVQCVCSISQPDSLSRFTEPFVHLPGFSSCVSIDFQKDGKLNALYQQWVGEFAHKITERKRTRMCQGSARDIFGTYICVYVCAFNFRIQLNPRASNTND